VTPQPTGPAGPIRYEYAIRTWHYLRLAMFALVLGLLAAVLHEHARTGCWQNSISAYWYTPARSYLVAMLTAMSVCMVCLRGSSTAENVLLNFAGLFAPVIALVPTTPEHIVKCMQVAGAAQERPGAIANNATALFAVAGVAAIIALLIWRKERPAPAELLWSLVALAIALAALGVFVFARGTFDACAHLTAAGSMFACIIAVAWVNGTESEPHGWVMSYRNAYLAIAILMSAAVLATGLAAWLGGWSHLTIWIEVVLIALFAAFWALQTIELWDRGLRPHAKPHA